MGDPKKPRKQYSKPLQMWAKTRVDEEKQLAEEYGLKNRREIWRSSSMLRNLARQAKSLIALRGTQAEKEKQLLLARLESLGLIEPGAELTSVLSLTVKDMLDRRLQTIVFRKNFARSISQARQMVAHRHISVGDNKVTVPSYIVKKNEEDLVTFDQNSPFADAMHPERVKEEKNDEAAEQS